MIFFFFLFWQKNILLSNCIYLKTQEKGKMSKMSHRMAPKIRKRTKYDVIIVHAAVLFLVLSSSVMLL